VTGSCYGSARDYTAIRFGIVAYWPGVDSHACATTNCADINVKTNYTRHVKVCRRSGGMPEQHTTLVRQGEWTVVATNARDGAYFHVVFDGENNGTGKVAY